MTRGAYIHHLPCNAAQGNRRNEEGRKRTATFGGISWHTPNRPLRWPGTPSTPCSFLSYFLFVSDLAFWRTSNDFWANASLWLLGVDLITAALAAVMSLVDVVGDAQIRDHSDAWLQAGGNVIAVVAYRHRVGISDQLLRPQRRGADKQFASVTP